MSVEIEPPVRALNELIRREAAPGAMREDFEGWLTAQGVSGPDLDAMLEVGAERLLVYRRLVHNRMRNTMREFIPRTAARLGKPTYRAYIDRYMDEVAPITAYLRDVPAEFVAWAVPKLLADPDVSDYLADLARHELLQIDVRNDPRGGEAPTGNAVALDRPLRFDGAARRIDYDYAVHELPRPVEDRTEPKQARTQLLVYRDDDNKPRYLDLIPLAAALLDRLLAGEPLEPAIRGACEQIGEPLDDDKLAQAAMLLADLGERGVMLGAE